MDILFLNPPWHKKSGNIWKSVSSCMPPFGLGILAALARENGFSTAIIDYNAECVGLDRAQEYLPNSTPKFIGITATTILIDSALELAKIAKKKYPETKIIIGGVHATVMPKEVLSNPEVDYILTGEGENSFLELLAGKDLQTIKSLGFKNNNEIVLNQPQAMIADINVFPVMAYDLLPMAKYYSAPGSFKREPSFGMITSRGCPGRCTFCNGDLFGSVIRFRSAEKMVEEIKFLQKNYGIKDIVFYDDTFTSNRKRVREFCRLILENNLDLTWSCFSRVDTVDLEILKEMKKAGCHQIMYGVESGDPQILENINKKISLQKVEEAVAYTKKAGLDVRLAFMLGNPGETEQTLKKTIKFAIDLDPDLVSFNITTPYPGTQMFAWAKDHNCLVAKSWDEYDLSKPVMKLPTVDPDKILSYYKKAHRQFYFRPSYIIRKMLKIRSFKDFQNNLKPFLNLLKFTVEK